MNQSEIKIKDFKVKVRLGCSIEEQAVAQPVTFNISIIFDQKIRAEISDQLSDSLDYVEITNLITKISEIKSYNMIEHLCSEVLNHLKLKLENSFKNKIKGQLSVRALKMQTPVQGLLGGVEWTCKTSL